MKCVASCPDGLRVGEHLQFVQLRHGFLRLVHLVIAATIGRQDVDAAVGTYMALVPMFLGYILFGWGLAHVPASTATTLSLLEPAVAAVLAVLVVGERSPVLGWAGIALVVGCLAVLTAPPRRTAESRVVAAAPETEKVSTG